MRTVCLAAVLVGIVATMPCRAGDPARVADMEKNIAQAMRLEINTPVFWQPLGDGTVREKRTGVICTGELRPELPLQFLSGPVPADAQSVVGCIYRSADRANITHLVIAPNLLGTDFMRKLMPILAQIEKGSVSLGKAPVAGIPDSEEETLTSVKDGKKQLHYWVSAPAGKFFLMVHTIAPQPETIDVKTVRAEPVAFLTAARANITSR